MRVPNLFKLSRIKNLLGRKAMLSRIMLLLVLLVAGLVVTGCVQPRGQPKGWSGVAVADGVLFVGSMEGKLVSVDISTHSRLWADVSLETAKTGGGFGCAAPSTAVAIYGTPAVSEDLVYVAGYNGRIYAVNSKKGKEEWQYPPRGEPYLKPIVGGVVVAGGKVIFGASDGKVYAVDAASGVEAWGEPFETGDKIWSTPAIEGDTVYVSSFDRKLYALNIADGNKRWEFETGGAIATTPLLYNNTVYFGSFDRHVYAVDAANGKQIWKFPLLDESENNPQNWFWAKAVAHNSTIYAPSLDGKVYILDARTGREVVDAVDLGSPISSSPVLVNSSVIIASEEGKIYSLDTKTNQLTPLAELEKEEIRAPLSASKEVVFVHTQKDETLYALNAQTGVTLWKITLSSK